MTPRAACSKKPRQILVRPCPNQIINYDQKGRIISITGDPLGTSTFEYDDKGHKTLIRVRRRPNRCHSRSSTAYLFPGA